MTTLTAGFVLVGGRSRRMGRDKALIEFQEEPLATRLARTVQAAAGSATLVGSRGKYQHLGWPLIEDVTPGRGPLGGLRAILRGGARWNLVVGCDLPFVTREFLSFLLELAAAADTQVAVPISEQGYEPLVAVYRSDCLREVEKALRARRHKMTLVIEGLSRREVLPREWRRFDPEGILFQNVNSPEDLARARRRTGACAPGRRRWIP